jgi:Family of unknown function (DUF5317)
MFMLYALPIGLAAGWLAGGQVGGLTSIRLRWAPLALVGLLAQVLLFLEPVVERIGGYGVPIYVGSSALVLVVVLRNVDIPGLLAVAGGATLNLVAILANGGYMPASSAALSALGKTVNPGYSNSLVTSQPVLAPLTDLFALPAWLPFANIFSVGDVMIGLGVAWVVATAMRSGAPGNLPPKSRALGTDER